MTEPWKAILCDSPPCREHRLSSEQPGATISSLNRDALEEYRIYPDIDNETFTQFTCSRCGTTTTWGITRRAAAKALYEHFEGGAL